MHTFTRGSTIDAYYHEGFHYRYTLPWRFQQHVQTSMRSSDVQVYLFEGGAAVQMHMSIGEFNKGSAVNAYLINDVCVFGIILINQENTVVSCCTYFMRSLMMKGDNTQWSARCVHEWQLLGWWWLSSACRQCGLVRAKENVVSWASCLLWSDASLHYKKKKKKRRREKTR